MNDTVICVAIADDHNLFREGLKLIIEGDQGLHLVLESSNGQELLDAIEGMKHKPDV
ncbi:MAG TPA: DNA-binding response regulator, partial [Cryomorphaceae bacterium]|nr:DNA-binding response regulator [Cryomorphaceae bacterium]